MRHEPGLGRRVLIAMLVMVGATTLIFDAAVLFLGHRLEHSLSDLFVDRELDEAEEYLSQSRSDLLLNSASLSVWVDRDGRGKEVPPVFASLPVGKHHDIFWERHRYHVGVRDTDGGRLYAALDITEVERLETLLSLIVTLGTLALLFVAWVSGVWLSRAVVSPVSDLASEVAGLDPAQRGQPIAPRYRGYEVEALARAIDRYSDRLAHFLEREQLFTSAASHELRSPLTVIASSSELLESDARMPAALRQHVSRIRNAVRSMIDLTNALLTIARESPSDLKEEPWETHVEEELGHLIEECRARIEGRDIEIVADVIEPLPVNVPQGHVQIVIGNLLRNALDFTEHGHIALSLSNRRLRIKDTGRGISESDLPHVFDCRYRGSDSNGSGLGLYIAKLICDRHGWRLELQSEPGKGCCATVAF